MATMRLAPWPGRPGSGGSALRPLALLPPPDGALPQPPSALALSQAAQAPSVAELTTVPALLLQSVGPGARRALELWSLLAASSLALVFAFYSCRLAWQSLAFNDISTSNDATPLWIPQLSMALGTVVFAIAFIDELVLEWRGRVKAEHEEPLRHE